MRRWGVSDTGLKDVEKRDAREKELGGMPVPLILGRKHTGHGNRKTKRKDFWTLSD